MNKLPFGLGALVTFLSYQYAGYIHKNNVKQLFRAYGIEMVAHKQLETKVKNYIEENFLGSLKGNPNWEIGLQSFMKPVMFTRELKRHLSKVNMHVDKHRNTFSISFDATVTPHHKIFISSVLCCIMGHYARVDSQVVDDDFAMHWVGTNLDTMLDAALGYYVNDFEFSILPSIEYSNSVVRPIYQIDFMLM